MAALADTTARIEREQEFHDTRFGDDSARSGATKYYRAVEAGPAFYRQRVRDLAGPGAAALEYGCGVGSRAFELASTGTSVTGIDISPVAIATARSEAERRGCDADARFVVANAEDTGLDAAAFDIICGSGILHHLDLDAATDELARLLTADGTAVFLEPLGHNPLINWYRSRTPEMRSVDEHPLLRGDIEAISQRFHVRTRCFGLTAIAGGWLSRIPVVGRRLPSLLNAVDRVLLSVGPMRWYAWMIVLELRPKATRRPFAPGRASDPC